MSKFFESLAELQGKKIRFYTGGGEQGVIQGPVTKIDGNLIFIEKDGDIRGTMHTITVNADTVRFYEQDVLTDQG